MKTIVTITLNPAIDKSSSVVHVVAEHKLYCTPPRFEPGGGGVNVSRAIKKLGGNSRLLYPAGGLTGKRLQELLDEEGLNHRPFPIEGVNRESLVILEESTGRQYRFGMPGPKLRKKQWDQFLQELSAMAPPPDYVVASGYLIKPNVREFRELVGEEIKEESQIKAEAQKMVRNGRCEVLVISLGAAGALAVSKDFAEHIVPPTVPIISKVGAGDSMVAGLTLSLALGKPIRESVLFGVAAGTAAVMTPGTELCRREDTERLYAGMITGH